MSKIDPTTQRHIQTRDGVASIPRNQTGVSFKEYFRNTELPENLERTVIHETEKGPVLAAPDPETWSQKHDDMARDYADRLKTQIEEKGYYSKSLSAFAGRLADATGHPREEMKAVIAKSFEANHGKDPYTYLSDQRAAQGKPVRDLSHSQSWSHDPQ
jgi:hypothetical protein